MSENRNKLGTMPIPRLVANVSLPLMVSMLVQSLYNIVDGIFVARISTEALTATSLAYPMQLVMIAVSVGTGVGVNALLSRRLGQRDAKGASAAATNGLLLSLLCTVVFMGIGLTCLPAFFRVFTQDAVLAALGEEYLSICMLFCLGIFMATMGERLLQATGNTFASMLAQSFGAVINIVLDPILIFGWLGLPAMGIRGAAIATVIGQWGAAAAALLLNHYKNREVHFDFRGFRPDAAVIGLIYKVGAPTIVVQMTSSLMLIGMNKLLLPFSAIAVAVFGVYYKLQTFVYMPVSGLAQGLIPIVGYNLGARRIDRARQAYRLAAVVAAIIMAAGTLVFELFPEWLLSLYNADAEMLRLGVPALRIIGATFVPMSFTVVTGFACSGAGSGLANMVGALLRQLVVLLPVAWLLARFSGVDAVWFAFWASELVAAAVAALFAKRFFGRRAETK